MILIPQPQCSSFSLYRACSQPETRNPQHLKQFRNLQLFVSVILPSEMIFASISPGPKSAIVHSSTPILKGFSSFSLPQSKIRILIIPQFQFLISQNGFPEKAIISVYLFIPFLSLLIFLHCASTSYRIPFISILHAPQFRNQKSKIV